MGKFDGILICSDIDGTFSAGNIREIDEINSKAVKYFTDNGGRFTFATGRGVAYVRNLEFSYVLNAPVCLYNGGIIYDYEKERVLYEKRLEMSVREFADIICEYKAGIQRIVIFHDISEDSLGFTDIADIPADVLSLTPIKIVCVFETPEEADQFKSFAIGQEALGCCCILKSWPLAVEFNAKDATKGDAICFIKSHLGNIHMAIGIGDYENDLLLLRHADIGVAVGNAIEELKQSADLIVKDCRECAIKDLIDILDQKDFRQGDIK